MDKANSQKGLAYFCEKNKLLKRCYIHVQKML